MEVKADSDPAPDRRARVVGTAALIAVLVAPGLWLWLWSRPNPALPTEMPALTLPADEVARQRRADDEAARAAPAAEAHTAAWEAVNRAELTSDDRPGAAALRRRTLVAQLAAVEAEHGEQARAALRARDVARTMAALSGEGDAAATLGAFITALERYAVVRDGRQRAPRFVVRTLAKARWNGQHGLEPTDGLSPLERRAFFGWLALGAEGAPLQQRLDALDGYEAADGERADEARGSLLLRLSRLDDAREAFERAGAARPSFRLRNHALAAQGT